jgi:hypothetical protein
MFCVHIALLVRLGGGCWQELHANKPAEIKGMFKEQAKQTTKPAEDEPKA